METDNLYPEIYNIGNLILAWRKARKGKTKKEYVIEFEQDTLGNLLKLSEELKTQAYKLTPLKTFILRDPKTRKISKSAFRDRIVHHALFRIIEPIFDKGFIYDSCANRIGKGNLFALKRFDLFKRRVVNNLKTEAFCLKADIKHYFQEVNHEILLGIIKRKITDGMVIGLIKKILNNAPNPFCSRPCSLPESNISLAKSFAPPPNETGFCKKGMPLGNLTSQFFANVYLNELDYFVKHKLKAKYYIRYVDDFVILHKNKAQLEIWETEISVFLRETLRLELHPQKSKIIPLSKGIDFVGFRNFYYYRLLRKRNVRKMRLRVNQYKKGELSKKRLLEIFQGWNAYAKWANSFKLRREVVKGIYKK